MTCELKNDLKEQLQAKINHSNKDIREQIQVAKYYFKKEIGLGTVVHAYNLSGSGG